MSCIHNWSLRLSLYLKRQVTIWRDSMAAIRKRRGPSLPGSSTHCGSWDVPQSAFESAWRQLGSFGNRERLQGDSSSQSWILKGEKKGFLSGQISLYDLILWKAKRPGDIISCLCRHMKVFSPMKTTPQRVPFSLQSNILTKCIHFFGKLFP